MANKKLSKGQSASGGKLQKEHRLKREIKEFRKQFAKKTLDLMTSGFGLVAALAWNEVIKELIEVYIKPIFGGQSGLISRLIYAILITLLAVLVTYNLSKFAGKDKED